MGSYFSASEVEQQLTQIFCRNIESTCKSANTNGNSFLLLLSIYSGIEGRLDDGCLLEFCFILCNF